VDLRSHPPPTFSPSCRRSSYCRTTRNHNRPRFTGHRLLATVRPTSTARSSVSPLRLDKIDRLLRYETPARAPQAAPLPPLRLRFAAALSGGVRSASKTRQIPSCRSSPNSHLSGTNLSSRRKQRRQLYADYPLRRTIRAPCQVICANLETHRM
jgi:hypothetical protein